MPSSMDSEPEGRDLLNNMANKKKQMDVQNDKKGPVEKVHMKKEVSMLYATAIMTGIMIGSGIFVSPISIVHHCGSIGLSLIVWLMSGLLALTIALCYAEIGIIIPESGADYAYYKYIFGYLPAFLNAWMMFVIVNPSFYAVLALTSSTYLMQPFFPDCQAPDAAIKLFSVWIIVTIGYLNCVYVRYVTRVQTLLAAAKIIALIIIIVAGLVQIGQGNTELLQDPFQGTTSNIGAVAIAMYSGIFTYGGWQYLFMLVEEVKDPYKNVPRAVVISFVLVITIYLLTNVAYFTVMSPQEMMASNAVAVTFAERTMGKFSLGIPIFVACSTIGALNGAILGGSRVYFAAARDNVFPSVLALISLKYTAPIPSVWTTCVVSILYVLTGDAVTLIEYLGFVATLVHFITLGCVIYLQIKEPELSRPIKMPLFLPILGDIVLAVLMVLGLYYEPVKNGMGVLIVLCGIPVYIVCVSWTAKPKQFSKLTENLTFLVQKILMAAPEEEVPETEEDHMNYISSHESLRKHR